MKYPLKRDNMLLRERRAPTSWSLAP